jgi:hypothetical protein
MNPLSVAPFGWNYKWAMYVNVSKAQIYTKKAGPSLVFVNFLALASAPFYLTKTSFRWLLL